MLASVRHPFIQTALLARDAICPHSSILPLNVTMNLQSSTYYMLLYTSNARKEIAYWAGDSPSAALSGHSVTVNEEAVSLLCFSMAMSFPVFFFF